jgi:ATP-dependent RNA helicase DeaD
MLDIGFAKDIGAILAQTPAERQTALFSTTMPVPIRQMVNRHLKAPQWVRVGAESQAAQEIDQVYYEVARDERNIKLDALLRNGSEGQTIIFCRTQHGVDRLMGFLERRGHAAQYLHGGLNQSQRNRALQAFRSGQSPVLVATNVASRGLDIPAVSRVINYDMPQTLEEYIHRAGRTGRMGRAGLAITFVSEWDFEVFDAISRRLGKVWKKGTLPAH